jgi:chromosome segregation ATPase
MTMSEFDTLRADITGLRTDLQGQVASFRSDLQAQIATVRTELQTQIAELRGDLQTQIAGVRTDMGTLRTDMEARLIRLEVKIDEKPSAATIYQAALATFTGTFAVIIGTIIVLKTTGFIP